MAAFAIRFMESIQLIQNDDRFDTDVAGYTRMQLNSGSEGRNVARRDFEAPAERCADLKP